MKKIIWFLLLSNISSAFSVCANKNINHKKVVMFIDVNASYLEGKAAQEAACARGEDFVWLPAGEEFSHRMLPFVGRANLIDSELDDEKVSAEDKVGYKKQLEQLNLEMDAVKKGMPLVNLETVQNEMTTLSDKKIAISSVIISGHDGGGEVRGILGFIDKNQFIQAFQEGYKKHPELIDHLENVLMWGCYTATPGEVLVWKESFPELKIMAGFMDVSPLAERPASSAILKDILIKSQLICAQTEKKKLKQVIESIKDFPITLSAIYVRTSCQGEWYYGHRAIYDKEDNLKRVAIDFGPLASMLKCDSFFSAGNNFSRNALNGTFEEYYEGNRKIPKDTAHSPLRLVYTTVRQFSHCVDRSNIMYPDRVGLLVFYNNVRKNFLKVFNNEIENALEEFKNNSKNIATKNYPELNALVRSGVTDQTFLDRANVKDLLSELTDFTSKLTSKNSKKYPNLIAIKSHLDNYLYRLNPECMDFLEWHEYKEGVTPAARCQ